MWCTATTLPAKVQIAGQRAQSHKTLQAMPTKPNYKTHMPDKLATVELNNAYKFYRLTHGPDTIVTLSKMAAIELYTQMLRIRRLETAINQMHNEKLIRGFCPLCIGQEACDVGISAALRKQDAVVTGCRCHGMAYLMGATLAKLFAEWQGKFSGLSRGKGGPMHLYTDALYGGYSIMGSTAALGAGIALARKQLNTQGVCLAIYDNVAANQGQVFEAYNLACLLKLPCVFVCENQHLATDAQQQRTASNTNYYTRGHYLAGVWVNATNVLAVRTAMQFAIDYALRTGPLIIELHTYRLAEHTVCDPDNMYGSCAAVPHIYKTCCPILQFEQTCLKLGFLTANDCQAMRSQVRREIKRAVASVAADAEPALGELASDVYQCNLEPKIRGISSYSLEHKLNKKNAVRKKNKL